jgi:hypothetical protein
MDPDPGGPQTQHMTWKSLQHLFLHSANKDFQVLTDLVEPEIFGWRVPSQIHAVAPVAAAAVVAVSHHSQHLELGHFVRDI